MDYAAVLSINTPARVARWRVLVHWLLVIPHLVVLIILQIVAQILFVLAWIIGIFAGKIPEPLAKFFAMALRYEEYVGAYLLVLVEQYPPFDLSLEFRDSGNYPVRVDFEPKLTQSRWGILFRPILIIPALVVLAVLGAIFYVVLAIMFFVILIAGRWPRPLWVFMVGVAVLSLRVRSYLFFLTNQYPIGTAGSPFASATNNGTLGGA